MNYCTKCRKLMEESVCPQGRRHAVRVPQEGDLCFLTQQSSIFGAMLADVLEQNDIPCIRESVLGAALAMTVGINRDKERFYVPFELLPQARELTEELFGAQAVTPEPEEP